MEKDYDQESFSSEVESEVYCGSHAQNKAVKMSFRNKNRFKWTPEENKKYCCFLYENLSIFNSEKLRKKAKIFSQLSSFILSRTTSQVKSHHQKMMKRHIEIKNIIRYMERKLNVIIMGEPIDPKKKETREV
jgi:hypothetical protein